MNQAPTARTFAGEPRSVRIVRGAGALQEIFAPRAAIETVDAPLTRESRFIPLTGGLEDVLRLAAVR